MLFSPDLFRKNSLINLFDWLTLIRKEAIQRMEKGIFLVLFFSFCFVIYQISFPKEDEIHFWVNNFLRQVPRILLLLYFGIWGMNVFVQKEIRVLGRKHINDLLFGGVLLFFEAVKHKHYLFESEWFLYLLLSVFFVIRAVSEGINLQTVKVSPAVLFAFSFFMLILVGTAFLLVPVATNGNLTLIDALFTATSAVCVTGLTVVDTATKFTGTGQSMLLILIQIGGLGLMTFTNFFAALFKGGMSFRNHQVLRDFVQTDRPDSLVGTLLKIVVFTLVMEFSGILMLYFTADFGWNFSLFHSISAFCNAGFSTVSDGLYHADLRFNYSFQLVICFLVIFGGIGFPVVIDLYYWLKATLYSFSRTIFFQEPFKYQARNFSVHTRLVISSTVVLLVFGMATFYLTERNNVLLDHNGWYAKLVQSFFGAVTPRTAGFNTVDMGNLMQGTVLIYLLLMWIGASPSSTGGGIKTTTFTIAFSNIIALAKGKDRVDIFRREIDNASIHRSYAVIFLSLLIIGLAVFLISIFEPEQNLSAIAFECFSAYSTVGLTLNLTPHLGDDSKIVLIITMFLGRVGMFTLLFGLFTKVECKTYRYPKETVLIS